MRHIIDLSDLSMDEFNELYALTTKIIDRPEDYAEACRGKVLGSLFYEPSTRTNLSFSTAMMRLGGSVVGFSDPNSSSAAKGESLKATISMVSNYADMIVMRNPKEGAAYAASLYSAVPVINAGDGGHLHPTQTLADMTTILRLRGSADNMKIGICGDLKYGRTVHSLIMAMYHFNPTFNFIACDELKMPVEYKIFCDQHGIKYTESRDFGPEIINNTDILYMTRVQRERFTDLDEYERVKNIYTLRNAMLADSRPNLRILHPLPRVGEINPDVDDNAKPYYFNQAQNGLKARQAIICKVLGIDLTQLKNSAK